uniref:Uncharacterized protein n=1 Tax=Lepeophtheirus salmonis TaxID=72036 RepID=A0A0K2TF50_LEPSM
MGLKSSVVDSIPMFWLLNETFICTE